MGAASIPLLKPFARETLQWTPTLHPLIPDKSGYAAAQSRALDAIGNALKHRRIDFYIATKLRDLVRMGRVDEAERMLRRYRQDPKH